VKENSIFVIKALAARSVTTPEGRVAAAAVGAIGYYSDRFTVDLLGKCDSHVAHLPMRRATTGNPLTHFWPGHLKWDCEYSIGRQKPDVVTQLWNFAEEARPYLERDFVLARVDFADTVLAMALRKDSPRVRWDAVTHVMPRRPGRILKWRLIGALRPGSRDAPCGRHGCSATQAAAITCAAAFTTAAMRPMSRSCCVVRPSFLSRS
jgi:hypothetical protein